MRSKLLSLSLVLAALAPTACGRCDFPPSAQGSLSAGWSITADSKPVTCARAGAASVSMRLHHRDSSVDTVFSFACTAAQATTAPVATGTYDVTLALRSAGGDVLVEAPTQAATVIPSSDITPVLRAVFPVLDLGELVLSAAVLDTASNCGTPDHGGAGLTGFRIVLEHADDGCAAVTFTRSRGTTTLGTYTVDCSFPAVTSCIERDEILTANGLPSGPYVVSMTGLRSALSCRIGADVLSVPAGAIATQRIELVTTHIPGC